MSAKAFGSLEMCSGLPSSPSPSELESIECAKRLTALVIKINKQTSQRGDWRIAENQRVPRRVLEARFTRLP